jgi:hypothetical protein
MVAVVTTRPLNEITTLIDCLLGRLKASIPTVSSHFYLILHSSYLDSIDILTVYLNFPQTATR